MTPSCTMTPLGLGILQNVDDDDIDEDDKWAFSFEEP